MRYWDVEGTEPPPPFIIDMYRRWQKVFSKRMSKKFKKAVESGRVTLSTPADKNTGEDFKKLWIK